MLCVLLCVVYSWRSLDTIRTSTLVSASQCWPVHVTAANRRCSTCQMTCSSCMTAVVSCYLAICMQYTCFMLLVAIVVLEEGLIGHANIIRIHHYLLLLHVVHTRNNCSLVCVGICSTSAQIDTTLTLHRMYTPTQGHVCLCYVYRARLWQSLFLTYSCAVLCTQHLYRVFTWLSRGST